MIKELKSGSTIVLCDICAKQIVSQRVCCDDPYITGPMNETVMLCGNNHCCSNCYPDYRDYYELMEG